LLRSRVPVIGAAKAPARTSSPYHFILVCFTGIKRLRRLALAVLVLATIALGAPHEAQAHDIPGDVTVRAFIKPDGQRLRFLIRVPMVSIHDIEWPLVRTDGTLDLTRIDQALHDAANIWFAEGVDMFEG